MAPAAISMRTICSQCHRSSYSTMVVALHIDWQLMCGVQLGLQQCSSIVVWFSAVSQYCSSTWRYSSNASTRTCSLTKLVLASCFPQPKAIATIHPWSAHNVDNSTANARRHSSKLCCSAVPNLQVGHLPVRVFTSALAEHTAICSAVCPLSGHTF
jgi:hypothetical protein